MHRLAVMSLCAFIPMCHSASHAHANLDTPFAKMTALDVQTFTVSMGVLLSGSESAPPITSYGLGGVTDGLGAASVHSISPLSDSICEQYERVDDIYLIRDWDGVSEVIDPGPEPIELFLLSLEVSQASGPFTIDADYFTFLNTKGEVIPTVQKSSILTIPVPASLAFLVGSFIGALVLEGFGVWTCDNESGGRFSLPDLRSMGYSDRPFQRRR